MRSIRARGHISPNRGSFLLHYLGAVAHSNRSIHTDVLPILEPAFVHCAQQVQPDLIRKTDTSRLLANTAETPVTTWEILLSGVAKAAPSTEENRLQESITQGCDPVKNENGPLST